MSVQVNIESSPAPAEGTPDPASGYAIRRCTKCKQPMKGHDKVACALLYGTSTPSRASTAPPPIMTAPPAPPTYFVHPAFLNPAAAQGASTSISIGMGTAAPAVQRGRSTSVKPTFAELNRAQEHWESANDIDIHRTPVATPTPMQYAPPHTQAQLNQYPPQHVELPRRFDATPGSEWEITLTGQRNIQGSWMVSIKDVENLSVPTPAPETTITPRYPAVPARAFFSMFFGIIVGIVSTALALTIVTSV